MPRTGLLVALFLGSLTLALSLRLSYDRLYLVPFTFPAASALDGVNSTIKPVEPSPSNAIRVSPPMPVYVAPLPAVEEIDFNRDIRPILSDNCFTCHGPDAHARKGKLRLDERASAVSDRGGYRAIDPGHANTSEIIGRISSKDEAQRMPPSQTGKRLSDRQEELLRRWIAGGAEYTSHWAFRNPTRPTARPLDAQHAAWARNPIDLFVIERLLKEGFAPSSEADKATLIRRVYLDLTGLPPTPSEVDAFLQDSSADAYEKVVDRLLASPRFGERMALEWLDAARYADTHGYHLDHGRQMTPWRDWVIRAFNDNKPFDQFTIEQLAGDLLPDPTPDQRIATGFNRNHPMNSEGGSIPEEFRVENVADRVNTTGTVFLGISLGCARCHDHKFDPLSQKEYYQLFSFFNNIDEGGTISVVETNAPPRLRFPTYDQQVKSERLRRLIAVREAAPERSPAQIDREYIAWEAEGRKEAQRWTDLSPIRFSTATGAPLTELDDLSICVDGPTPDRETFTVTIEPALENITALRVETLPDPKFPKGGPGRAKSGSFVMTGLHVIVHEPDGDRPLAVRRVSGTFSQKAGNFDVATLAKPGGGWAIHPEVGVPHFAIVEFEQPLSTSSVELTVTLEFQSPYPQYSAGRIRLSATTDPNPHARSTVAPALLPTLKLNPEYRSAEQAKQLRTAHQNQLVRETKEQLESLKKQLAETETGVLSAMVMAELPKPRDTHVHIRGQYDHKGEKVGPGTPAFLPPLPDDALPNRLGLARWLVSPQHPLTARVAVNRYWQMYFGTGIVKTSEEFGSQGEWPTHPELLDWLACEFREPTCRDGARVPHAWDVKHIQRLIVTSATYRQSSKVRPELAARDPENRLLARMTRVRLPAEFIRDQALAVSGLLHEEIGGRSVFPYQPAGLWEELSARLDSFMFSAQTYTPSQGKDLYRRTMYSFWKRSSPPPSAATFDAPNREVCTVRRPRTNTPLQALVLLNDPTYLDASRKLAERMMAETGPAFEEKISFAFRLCLGRQPDSRELAILRRVYDARLAYYRGAPSEALKLLAVGDSQRDPRFEPAELAAWAMVASTILNLDEMITRN